MYIKGNKLHNQQGITLIALVVSVVVLIIIAGISISTLTKDSGTITQATHAKISTELKQINDYIQYKEVLDNKGNSKNDTRYLTVQEFNNKYAEIQGEYKDRLGIYRDQIYFLGREDDEISKIAKECGYKTLNMTEDEFKYYIELGILEDKVKENKNKRIGRELQTSDFPGTIKIGKYTYSNGWYVVGNYTNEEKNNNTYGEQFKELEIEDITHAPYLVNYDTGVVLSINGMIMYQSEVAVHTFQDNNLKLVNSITFVGDTSVKNGDYFGNLYSTSLYKGSYNNKNIYSDNNGKLQYDSNNTLILDKDNAIPVLDVDDKYQINDSYSANITVEGELLYNGSQYGEVNNLYPATILALSDEIDKYICWVGVFKGYLHVYSYKAGSKARIDYETKEKGFASIDISEYQNKKINIQIVGERGKETKVYLNGELISTFESGSNEFTYKNLTIGDLRVGRNLKFIGKVYNFAIYGVALSENEIQQNYEESK